MSQQESPGGHRPKRRPPDDVRARFGCDQNMRRMVAPAFADSHMIVLFDRVGAGRSDLAAWRPHRYATLSGRAADVLEI